MTMPETIFEYIPKWLRWVRTLEPALRRPRTGAQYAVIVERWS
jgi:hypothetical protein